MILLRPIDEGGQREHMRGFAGLVLLFIGVGGQAAERGPWNEVQPEIIRSHVEFLASDLLEGRATALNGLKQRRMRADAWRAVAAPAVVGSGRRGSGWADDGRGWGAGADGKRRVTGGQGRQGTRKHRPSSSSAFERS